MTVTSLAGVGPVEETVSNGETVIRSLASFDDTVSRLGETATDTRPADPTVGSELLTVALLEAVILTVALTLDEAVGVTVGDLDDESV